MRFTRQLALFSFICFACSTSATAQFVAEETLLSYAKNVEIQRDIIQEKKPKEQVEFAHKVLVLVAKENVKTEDRDLTEEIITFLMGRILQDSTDEASWVSLARIGSDNSLERLFLLTEKYQQNGDLQSAVDGKLRKAVLIAVTIAGADLVASGNDEVGNKHYRAVLSNLSILQKIDEKDIGKLAAESQEKLLVGEGKEIKKHLDTIVAFDPPAPVAKVTPPKKYVYSVGDSGPKSATTISTVASHERLSSMQTGRSFASREIPRPNGSRVFRENLTESEPPARAAGATRASGATSIGATGPSGQ